MLSSYSLNDSFSEKLPVSEVIQLLQPIIDGVVSLKSILSFLKAVRQFLVPDDIIHPFAEVIFHWVIIRAMRKRPKTGVEDLIGAEARVVSELEPHDEATYLVKIRGELWSANSDDKLKPGDKMKIISVKYLTLFIRKNGTG